MIDIYNSAGVLQCSFPRVLSASLCDKLSGERTLSFSVLASRSQPLSVGMTAKLDGQFYNIVRVSKKITGGFPVTTAQCEHITYLLNEEQYNLVTFVFEGTPADGMAQLLSGTPFTLGIIEATGRVECAFIDQSPLSRRNALMRFIDACGCEVEYDGYKIILRKHRGSINRKHLMDGENVTDLAVTIDSRENTQSYEISLFKMADLEAGDEVNITYTPMGVNVDTRIISIEYDPFYHYTIRKLKENGVECYFEKESIYTFDGKGELLITIMSSLAQEESRSISENITWGQRKSFSDGKVHLPYKRFLGYEKGEDGRPAVVESEARIVRLIYRLFLEGKTSVGICKYLEELGIPSPGGKPTWSKTTITSILQNEKYKGDALLQKKFTVDFLEKKMKPNEGEVPQYYVAGSHPAIIEPDEWDHVQAEIARRKVLGKAYSGKSVLSAKLVCEDCGAFFGSKVWHSTDRYRRTIWQCNSKFANEERCHTPVIDTETVQRLFIKAYNLMMQDRVRIIGEIEAWRQRLTDFGTLDADIERQLEETQVVAELVKAAVKENASTALSQEAYLKKYEALTERYEKAAAELERLQALRTSRSQTDRKMALYIRTLKKQPEVMHNWDDTIWTVMIEKAIVHKDGQITFVFQNGTEIKVGA